MEPLLATWLKKGMSLPCAKMFTCDHPDLPLSIFCYDNHFVYKSEDERISNQCRGLILEKGSWDVVCWGFDRFVKSKKTQSSDGKEKYIIQIKEDGTLLFLFHYKGRWLLTTRHTFCDQPSEKLYLDLFKEIVGGDADSFAKNAGLSQNFTYCFELCSSKNRIIRKYEQPTLFLLASFSRLTHSELPSIMLDLMVKKFNSSFPEVNLKRPFCVSESESMNYALSELKTWERNQELFEGFVLLNESTGHRLKVKSDFYKSVHSLRYRGWTRASPLVLLPLILNDLQSNKKNVVLDLLREIRHDFPEFQERWDMVKNVLVEEIEILSKVWGRLLQEHNFLDMDYVNLKTWVNDNCANSKLVSLFLKESRCVLNRSISGEPNWFNMIEEHILHVSNCLFPGKVDTFWFNKEKRSYCQDILLFEKSEMAQKPPFKDEKNTWRVFCCCSNEMVCKRLRYDYLYYQTCPCSNKELVDVLTYKSGSLLWICESCGCTHECFQKNDSFEEKTVEQSQPLGIPASKALKNLRLYLHHVMNQTMKSHGWKKTRMYDFLSDVLQVSKDRAHVAQMSFNDCLKVLENLKLLQK